MSRPAPLQLLSPESQRLITPGFLDGAPDELEPALWSPLSSPFARTINLAAFHQSAEAAMKTFERHDTALDPWFAPRLHRALPITRREAADDGVWRFLALVGRPELVRHRWANTSAATMRSRFLKLGTRPDSNAIARLWWIAELSRDGDDYRLTERVLSRQSLANAIFIRALSQHRPAISAAVEVLGDAQPEVIERVMLELNRWLALAPLEGLGIEVLIAELERLVERRD